MKLEQLIFLLLSFTCTAFAEPTLDSAVTQDLEDNDKADIMIFFWNSPSCLRDIREKVKSQYSYASKAERNTAMYLALKEFTDEKQKPVMDMLNSQKGADNFTTKQFWINHCIGVQGVDKDCVQDLMGMSEIQEIRKPATVALFRAVAYPDGEQYPMDSANSNYGQYPADADPSDYPPDPSYSEYPADPNYYQYPPDPSYSEYPADPNYYQYPPDPSYSEYPANSSYPAYSETSTEYPEYPPMNPNCSDMSTTTEKPEESEDCFQSDEARNAQPGVIALDAPCAWKDGNRGEGVVIGIIDSGFNPRHEAIRDNWRSDHGWYDAFAGLLEPSDENGHGTHVTGTACGNKNGIGVAPGAQFISCRAFPPDPNTEASEIDLMDCGQWIACPTDVDGGSDPRCDLAPDIASNSWGGDPGQHFFDEALATWTAMGIHPVFASGNTGDLGICRSVLYPGESPQVITIGAVDPDGRVPAFSGTGPTQNGTMKPDFVAPGVDILSAWIPGESDYNTLMGTSMATPHVSGMIALILNQHPDLTTEEIREALVAGAGQIVSRGDTCGGISDDQYPNNIAGSGLVNVRRTLKFLRGNKTTENPCQNPYEQY